jgi:hypothetical protein
MAKTAGILFARLSAPRTDPEDGLVLIDFYKGFGKRAKQRVPNPLVYIHRLFEAWSDSKMRQQRRSIGDSK